MYVNLLLVSRVSIVGQQALERAVYLCNATNSLKTKKEDLNFYGPSEVLPFSPPPSTFVTPEQSPEISDASSLGSSSSSTSRRKATCTAHHAKLGPNPEEIWLYLYADSLSIDPYDCECDKFD